MPIGLLVADDHAWLRAGLRQIFEGTDIMVVAEACAASEVLHLALDERVQVLLLDVSWARDDGSGTPHAGIDLLARIRAARPDLPVLMYSSRDDAGYQESCRRLGAAGYLVKGVDDARLIPGVRALFEGRSFWPAADPDPGLWTGRPAPRSTPSGTPLRLSAELAWRALDASPDAMIMVDADGAIRFASEQVGPLFGYSLAQMLDRPVETLLPERFQRRHLAQEAEFARHVRVRATGRGLELHARRADGTEFPVEISWSAIAEGGHTLVAATLRDISDRKRIEAELTVARERADRANQGKSRFLATASHDLRQPLQTLALLNGSLSRLVTEPQAVEAIRQQEQAIGAMSRLVNTLLDISKLESGAVRPQPVDVAVATLFQEIRREFAPLAAQKGLQLEVQDCALCVHTDLALIEQVLKNLVSNAIKYTHGGRVSVTARPDSDSRVFIDVSDTGVGIAPDQLPLIYDEFYQIGDPTEPTRNGYGLGLSIVQRIVKLLRLNLDVHSELGRGSCFSLAVPQAARLVPAACRSAASISQQRTPEHSPRVLLIEDDPSVRDATRMLLYVEGYRVAAGGSLAEALQEARADPGIDLLLVDYHLGNGETGIQVITSLRERLGFRVKAILLTGDTSRTIRDLPYDPQLRFARKPVQAEELLTLMRSLLDSESAPPSTLSTPERVSSRL